MRPRQDWNLFWLLGVGRSWRACTLVELGLIPWDEHCAIETNLWLPYLAFAAVEYNVILHSGLYLQDKVPAMFLWGPAIDAFVIVDGDDAWEMANYLDPVHLEDILTHLQAEGHVKELILPFMGIVCCMVGDHLIQEHTQKGVLVVPFGKCGSSTESVRILIYGHGFVVLQDDCHVKGLRGQSICRWYPLISGEK